MTGDRSEEVLRSERNSQKNQGKRGEKVKSSPTDEKTNGGKKTEAAGGELTATVPQRKAAKAAGKDILTIS